MEILRFEEAPTGAPKRKKSSRSFLALGLVATLFGISTAFASSTIAINGGTNVQLGQGVTAVTACDNAIGVVPTTTLAKDASGFLLSTITVGTGLSGASPDLTIAKECADKIFKITLYNDATTAAVVTCATDTTINGLQVLYVGATGSDFAEHACYNNSIYVKMNTPATTGMTFGLSFSTDIDSNWGFNLQDRPIGRITVETTSEAPPSFA